MLQSFKSLVAKAGVVAVLVVPLVAGCVIGVLMLDTVAAMGVIATAVFTAKLGLVQVVDRSL